MNHAPGRSPACEFANFTGAAAIGPHVYTLLSSRCLDGLNH
jgi:hypothetical protein